MSNEYTGASRETFSAAHVYLQVSHTDGTFSEVSVNLRPAVGADDVEDALAECCTPRDVLACLLHYAQDESVPIEDDSLSHAEQVLLSDEEIARSSRLLREALDETESAA
jgi:hypothetical protein